MTSMFPIHKNHARKNPLAKWQPHGQSVHRGGGYLWHQSHRNVGLQGQRCRPEIEGLERCPFHCRRRQVNMHYALLILRTQHPSKDRCVNICLQELNFHPTLCTPMKSTMGFLCLPYFSDYVWLRQTVSWILSPKGIDDSLWRALKCHTLGTLL